MTKLLSIDTETNGVDFRHGCLPFFVTTCDGDGNQQYWEWDVNPLTRKPNIPQEDVQAIQDLIDGADEIVGQNLKFDVTALSFIGIKNWPWGKTHDTLIAGHLLSSNTPHNLTDMAIQYLGVDIEPLELELEKCVKECRRVVQQAKLRTKRGKESSEFSDWYIADGDDPTMPSVSEKSWKADMWLPRAMDPTSTALADYSNADSSVTVSLWKVMEKKLKERNLWAIYQQRMKLLPVSIKMESRGITVSADRLNELTTKYQQESDEAHARCVNIAKGYGYDLELPKSSMNKSLSEFCFNVMKLPPLRNPKAKTDNPTFNKAAVEHYLSTLRPNSRELRFVQSLSGKRSRDTALGYMKAYQRFWRPVLDIDEPDKWYRLHPSLNPTGTDTLRWSCANPNEQNISAKEGFNLRYAFGPAPGREWWSLDAKNIELRLPAYESGETDMINLFERPDDPPYFGSNHALVAHIIYQKEFETCVNENGQLDGRIFKKRFPTLYKKVKNGNFACVPMSTQALTREGWKSYDEISTSDEVLGYEDGVLKWTPVRFKMKYESAPLIQMENNHYKSVSTPNHRWVTKKRTGNSRKGTRRWDQRFSTTQEIGNEHMIVLSAPTVDEGKLNITEEEAAIIGFTYGDGSIEMAEYTGASSQAGGRKTGFKVKMFQSKPEGVKYVDALLKKWGGKFSRFVRSTGIVVWVLESSAARDMWFRAGLWESRFSPNFEQFVIDLGSKLRTAYLDAIHVAEGSLVNGAKTYAQNTGKFADSIRLAVFLSGKFATTHTRKDTYGSGNIPLVFREGKPSVTGQRIIKTDLGEAPVWCITTGCGSWVMRQGDQIMLTGNSAYGAVEKASGWGTADRAYGVQGAQAMVKGRFTKIEELNQKCIRFANKHGYVETMPDKTVDPHRGYPINCTRTEYGRILETTPLNYHIQGTAMQWMNKAMVRVQAKLDEWRESTGFDGYLIMQVHDELVLDFEKSKVSPRDDKGQRSNLWRIKVIQKLMEEGGNDIGIPTPVSIEMHEHNWSEGVSF